MKVTLQATIKGREISIPIELNLDAIKELYQINEAIEIAEEEAPLTGWEEPRIGYMGYYEDRYNGVASFEVTEETIDFAHELYENDNFFSTHEKAETVIRADNVLRRLRHYAISHRKTDTTMAEGGYTITYNYQDHCLELGATGNWLSIGDVVFDTEETAQRAMAKYATELIWYFTEGKTAI